MRDAKAVDALHAACRASSCRDAALMARLRLEPSSSFLCKGGFFRGRQGPGQRSQKSLITLLHWSRAVKKLFLRRTLDRGPMRLMRMMGASDAPLRACVAVATSVVLRLVRRPLQGCSPRRVKLG